MRLLTFAAVTMLIMMCIWFDSLSVQNASCADSPSLWQARARATADNPKAARKVILDSLYAGQIVTVALAYEASMKQKPNSQERIANFAHAAMINESYNPQRGGVNGELVLKAFHALKPIVAPEIDLPPAERAKAALRQTRVADAWLAWGIYVQRFVFIKPLAAACYQKAMKLDPTFAEAHFCLGELAETPYQKGYFKTHYQEALRYLDTAQQMEPRLRPLVLGCKGGIAYNLDDDDKTVQYWQEYLRLWPEAPHADRLHKIIGDLEAAGKH